MKNILDHKLKELCHRYNNEVEKKEIEKAIFDLFYKHSGPIENRNYNKLSDILLLNDIHVLAIKAKNVHFAIKSTELVKSNKPNNKEYNYSKESFIKSLENHPTQENYIHYINTKEKLSHKDQDQDQGQDSCITSQLLKKASWVPKKHLYTSSIQQIIKYTPNESKSSIIVISNGDESYIIDALSKISKQVAQSDCKIIFVSNNQSNQTEKIISLSDTFIQLNGNTGAYLARNIGSIFANSQLLIFMEDDGIPAENFIFAHEKIHTNKQIITARGCYLNKNSGIMPDHYWLGMYQKNSAPNLEGNCSIKSQDFYKIGGWGDHILFGHGGYEICYRFLKEQTFADQHVYIPDAMLYHNWEKPEAQMLAKKLKQHASWHILKSIYSDIHYIKKTFKENK